MGKKTTKKNKKKEQKRLPQLDLFSGQMKLFSGSSGTTKYPLSPKEKAKALEPKVGKVYEGRFSYEDEKEILLLLAEEDAERWVAELDWAKEESESPGDFLNRMGFE